MKKQLKGNWMNKIKVIMFCVLFMGTAKAKDLTQLDLNQAAKQHFEATNFMLNKAYKQLMELDILDKDMKAKLKKTQKAWLKFRDLNSNFCSNEYKGGSLSGLIYVQKRIEMTQDRTAELTKIHLKFITP